MNELLLNGSPWWHLAGWTMIHFLWLGAAAGALAAAISLVLRRAPAHVRYVAAVASLAILTALPFGVAAWLVSTGPATQVAAMAEGQEAGSHPESARLGAASGELVELTNRDPALWTGGAAAEGDVQMNQATSAPSPVTLLDANPLADALRVLETAVGYLPWLWVTGTPLTFALLATGLVGTRRLRGESRLIDSGPIAEACARIARTLGVGRRMTVAVCERIAAPVLIGILRPMILLPPAALMGWSPADVEMVLLHELAHVRRWDNLVNLLQRLVESLLFFHPAVWLVSNWIRREREACCDAIVVGRTNEPQAYAEMLVSIAARMPRSVLFAPAVASAIAHGPLRSRVRQILKLEDDPMLVSGKSLALATLVLLLVVPVSVMQLAVGGRAEDSAVATAAPLVEMATLAEEGGPAIGGEKAGPRALSDVQENILWQALFEVSDDNPLETKTYDVPKALRERDTLLHLIEGWQHDPYGPRVKFFSLWNADKSQVEIRAAQAAHEFLFDQLAYCAVDDASERIAKVKSEIETSRASMPPARFAAIELLLGQLADQQKQWAELQFTISQMQADSANALLQLQGPAGDQKHQIITQFRSQSKPQIAKFKDLYAAITNTAAEVQSIVAEERQPAAATSAQVPAWPDKSDSQAEIQLLSRQLADLAKQQQVIQQKLQQGQADFEEALENLKVATPTRAQIDEVLAHDPMLVALKQQLTAYELQLSQAENGKSESRSVAALQKKQARVKVQIEQYQSIVAKQILEFQGRSPDERTQELKKLYQIQAEFQRKQLDELTQALEETRSQLAAKTGGSVELKNSEQGAPDTSKESDDSVTLFAPNTPYGEVVRAIDEAHARGYTQVEIKSDRIIARRPRAANQPATGDAAGLAEWEKLIQQVPLMDAVIANKMWDQLGLKVIPTTDKEDRPAEARRDSYRQGGADANQVKGMKIVGGNLPAGLPVPCYLLDIDGSGFQPYEEWLSWQDLESRSHRVMATDAQGRTYVFDSHRPGDDKNTAANAPNPTGQPAKSPFPSLEEQKLADRVFRTLLVEAEPASGDDLKRTNARGFAGGVRIEGTGNSAPGYLTPFQTGDILVGLHVWQTRNLQDIVTILNRDDLAELMPLKFYVIRRTAGDGTTPHGPDILVTGRVNFSLENNRESMNKPGIDAGGEPQAGAPPSPTRTDTNQAASNKTFEAPKLFNPDSGQPQPGYGSGPTDAQKRAALRYEAKSFDEWQNSWRTELSPEKRLVALKALTAFGANGYGKEAAEAILEIVKDYDWSYIYEPPVGKVQEQAIEAFGGNEYGRPVIPWQDWLPLFIAEYRSGDARVRKFAEYLLYQIQPTEANKDIVPELLKLYADEAFQPLRFSILQSLSRLYVRWHDKGIEEQLVASLKNGADGEMIISLLALYRDPLDFMQGGGGGGMFPGQPAPKYRADSEFRPELIDALRSEAENVRHELLGILAHLGPKAAPAVPRILPLTLEQNAPRPDSRFPIPEEAKDAVKAITGSDQALVDYWTKIANDKTAPAEKQARAKLMLRLAK